MKINKWFKVVLKLVLTLFRKKKETLTIHNQGYILATDTSQKEKINQETRQITESLVIKNEFKVEGIDTLSPRSNLSIGISMFDISLGIGI